jgi:hypothetical protein
MRTGIRVGSCAAKPEFSIPGVGRTSDSAGRRNQSGLYSMSSALHSEQIQRGLRPSGVTQRTRPPEPSC